MPNSTPTLDSVSCSMHDLVGYLCIRGRRYDDGIKGVYAEAIAEFQKMREVTSNHVNR